MKNSLRVVLFGIIVIFFIGLTGCNLLFDKPTSESTNDFGSPEEYLENPSIKDAINESYIDINTGDSPPVLSGEYDAAGSVTETSPEMSGLEGIPIKSKITLFNQTNLGQISFKEEIQGMIAWGTGGYITGESKDFTIWQDSEQTGSEAGLPDDISINVGLLMSGTKSWNGDLNVKGISIITDARSSNPNYNLDYIIGVWWMWEGDLILQNYRTKK